ncbi:MAG: murein biosynthesis integral membrane protein MurJ [Candidatus Kuenenbacteria bacterium]
MYFSKILAKLNTSITGGAIIIAVFSVASKMLALFRDRLLASGFGAGDILDAYYAAFKLPDLIFNTLVLGALSAAFIPVFIALKNKSAQSNGAMEQWSNQINHWQMSSAVMNIIFLAMLVLGVVFFVLAKPLMGLIAPGFIGEKLELAASMTRIMLISILFFGISNVLSGILQATKRFMMFALAPVMYNAGIIFGIVFLVGRMGPVGLAWGVVVGAGLHLAVQLPSVIRAGFKWQPVLFLKEKAVKKIGKLMLPRTLGLAVGQINQLVITIIGSTLIAGSIAVFNLAFNLASVPVSVFAISFAVASFPALSESAAKKDKEKFVLQLSRTVRKILYLIIPVSVFMIALRAQTVRLILGSGAFDWRATVFTADTLGYFCISLFAQGLVPVLARAFYARHDTKTPVIAGLFSVGVNILLSLVLSRTMGVMGLALSFSISSILNVILLAVILKYRVGFLDERNIGFAILKIITSTIGGVIFLQITKYLVAGMVDMQTFVGVMAQFLAAGIVGASIYILVSWILGSEEIKKMGTIFSRD